jgi:hypothetical protein
VRDATISRMITGYWDLAPSSPAQWAGAIATFSAVLVALFKDYFLRRWNRPELKVTCTREIPETVRVSDIAWEGRWPGGGGGRWPGDRYYVRIRVENTGRTRAKKVEVKAMTLAKLGLDNKFELLPTTLPFNMRWSNQPQNGSVTVLDGISRDMEAFCDIVSLWDPKNPYQRRPKGVPVTEAIGQLQLEFELTDEWHLLTSGTYRLLLKIGAANAKSINQIIEFRHDGMWTHDDVAMRRDHLAVSVI